MTWSTFGIFGGSESTSLSGGFSSVVSASVAVELHKIDNNNY